MAEISIHKVGVRRTLAPRAEPFWAVPLKPNQSIGYRKIDDARGSWIARYKADGRKSYKALGADSPTFGFIEARAAAIEWFAARDQGINSDDITLRDACARYVEVLRGKSRRGESSALDAKRRFERTVDDDALGRVKLEKLRKYHLKDWIAAQTKLTSPATTRRTFATLRAALNSAIKNDLCGVATRQAWTGLDLPSAPDGRRTLFLDLTQRRALLACCEGGLRDLVELAMLTGARAGEMTSATRDQFDERLGTMEFKGKTGPRIVAMTPPALALLKRLAKSKLPKARLLTRDDGKPWMPNDWRRILAQAVAAAGLPAATCLYTLRHSHISEALSGGSATLDIARRCGTSLPMIEKHYGHLAGAAALERLSKVQMT